MSRDLKRTYRIGGKFYVREEYSPPHFYVKFSQSQIQLESFLRERGFIPYVFWNHGKEGDTK